MKYLTETFADWICMQTQAPTSAPTMAPTMSPTAAPTITPAPTLSPTAAPTMAPTAAPTMAPIPPQYKLLLRYTSICSYPNIDNVTRLTNILTAAMVQAVGGYEPFGSPNNFLVEGYYNGVLPNVRDPENVPIQTSQELGTPADSFLYLKLAFFDKGNVDNYNKFMNALQQSIFDTDSTNLSVFFQTLESNTQEASAQYGPGLSGLLFIDKTTVDYYKQIYITKSPDFNTSIRILEASYTGNPISIDCSNIYSSCSEGASTLCFANISGAALTATNGKTRICPSDCPGNDCINWDSGYLEFKNMTKASNNRVSGDIIDVMSKSQLRKYTELYNLTSVKDGSNDGESNEVNCWLNCMNTAKCIGYKWDTTSENCTLYKNMYINSTSKLNSEIIKWMCNDDALNGNRCTWDGLFTKKYQYAGGPNGTYAFQPNPNCSVYNCEGVLDNIFSNTTAAPTLAPTSAPTLAPNSKPTSAPTSAPTVAPTPIPIDIININASSTFSDASNSSVLPKIASYDGLSNPGLIFLNDAHLDYFDKTVNLSRGISFITNFKFLKNYPYQNLFYLGSLGELDILCSEDSTGTKFRLLVRNPVENKDYECIGGNIDYGGKYQTVAGIYDFINGNMYLIVNRQIVGYRPAPKLSGTMTLLSSCIGCQSPQYPKYLPENSSMVIMYLRIYNRVFDLSEVSDSTAPVPMTTLTPAPTAQPTFAPTPKPTPAPTFPPTTQPPYDPCKPSGPYGMYICGTKWYVYGYHNTDVRREYPKPLTVDDSGRVVYSDNGVPTAFTFQETFWNGSSGYVYMYKYGDSSGNRVYIKYNYISNHVNYDSNWGNQQAYLEFKKVSTNTLADAINSEYYIIAHANCEASDPNSYACRPLYLKLDRDSNQLEGGGYYVNDKDYQPGIFKLVKAP